MAGPGWPALEGLEGSTKGVVCVSIFGAGETLFEVIMNVDPEIGRHVVPNLMTAHIYLSNGLV